MPWKHGDYPVSMKNLEKRVRDKAVDIANALLEEGYEEGRAIAIATAKAKEWDEDHPLHKHHEKEKESNRESDRSTARNPLHVVPHGESWGIKEEGSGKLRFEADTKAEAVDKAKEMASDANTSAIIHRKDGTVETSHNYS